MFVHATCVALRGGRRWHGVLLRGPSGAGKSDLALRVIDAGGRLVADDQTHVAKTGGVLVATPPRALAGMIEVRGIGIVTLRRTQVLTRVPVALLVDLVAPDRIERLPDPAIEIMQDIPLPRLEIAPFEASSVAKLRLALARNAAT